MAVGLLEGGGPSTHIQGCHSMHLHPAAAQRSVSSVTVTSHVSIGFKNKSIAEESCNLAEQPSLWRGWALRSLNSVTIPLLIINHHVWRPFAQPVNHYKR